MPISRECRLHTGCDGSCHPSPLRCIGIHLKLHGVHHVKYQMRRHHFLPLVLLLSFATLVPAATETLVCEAISKSRLKSQLRMIFDDERLKSFQYENEIMTDDEVDGHSCTVVAERGDQWTTWQDMKQTTVVSFGARNYSGQPFTPKIVVLNSRISVRISMDLMGANASFCGAKASTATSISYDRRSNKCRFKEI